MLEKPEFAKRLTELRLSKNVSARDMSLSLGQSAGYIANLENCVSYPSMTLFFYICDYLNVSPKEFFDTDLKAPRHTDRHLEASKGLSGEQIDLLVALAKELRRK